MVMPTRKGKILNESLRKQQRSIVYQPFFMLTNKLYLGPKIEVFTSSYLLFAFCSNPESQAFWFTSYQ